MSASPFTFQVSFSPAMTKEHWGVRDHFFDPVAPTLTEIDVHAARNEVAGVQLRLAGSQDFTLVLDRANWLHPLGFLPRLRLDVRFPGLPPLSTAGMKWPDALVGRARTCRLKAHPTPTLPREEGLGCAFFR